MEGIPNSEFRSDTFRQLLLGVQPSGCRSGQENAEACASGQHFEPSTAVFGFRVSDLFRISDFGFRICRL
jgi:hypothetical protein